MRNYVIALYIRLSVEDFKTESLSIPNQKLILREKAMSLPEWDNSEILEFIDNGHTGTNFERPAVQELLTMVQAGKINCIIVKDLSRFGRNSIETGYFIERVFPLYHTRFISVSDDFDTANFKGDTGGIDIAFKYLISECYSRDILAVLALHQLPDKVVKLQGQFLIFHIPPADQQRSGISAALAAQNKVGVRSADDAGGTADIVKGIVAVLQLSQVMHQQNGDVEAVGNALDGGNVIVIVAVHSCFSGAALGVPHLLQRVNDDQLGGGMLGQKVRNLLLQAAADQPGGHGKIQVVRGAVGKIVEPVFDAALGVLKAQIEHIALQCRQPPNRVSLRLVVTSSVSFVSPQAAKLTRSAVPPLPKKSCDFLGTPNTPATASASFCRSCWHR